MHDDSHLKQAQAAHERLKKEDTPSLREQIIDSIRGRFDVWRCVFEDDHDMWKRIARAEVAFYAKCSAEDYKEAPHPLLLKQIAILACSYGLRDVWMEVWKDQGLEAEAEKWFPLASEYFRDEEGWSFDLKAIQNRAKQNDR